jgi:hypothetical protein
MTSSEAGDTFPSRPDDALVSALRAHPFQDVETPRSSLIEPLQSRINSLPCPAKSHGDLGGLLAGIQQLAKLCYLIGSPTAAGWTWARHLPFAFSSAASRASRSALSRSLLSLKVFCAFS